jgi:hypothetical protein
MMSVVFAAMAMALDGGAIVTERRHAQSTADAAALAAAADLFNNYLKYNGADTKGTAASAAKAIASSKGYTNTGSSGTAAGNTSIVTVHIPPASGNFIGKAGYAEVVVQYFQPRYFSLIWGSASIPISARAVARGQWVPGSSGILVLGSSGTTVTMSGTANMNVQNGSITVDCVGPRVFNDWRRCLGRHHRVGRRPGRLVGPDPGPSRSRVLAGRLFAPVLGSAFPLLAGVAGRSAPSDRVLRRGG